jgi:hypothetical protein
MAHEVLGQVLFAESVGHRPVYTWLRWAAHDLGMHLLSSTILARLLSTDDSGRLRTPVLGQHQARLRSPSFRHLLWKDIGNPAIYKFLLNGTAH